MSLIIDVVIGVDAFGGGRGPDPLPRYFREDVEIEDDLFLGPMRPFRRDLVAACDPRGIGWEPPEHVFPVHFVMGRRDPPGASYKFDPDGRLKTSVLLSRLVQPTSLAYGRAGRVSLSEDGELSRFAPSLITGGPAKAYVADPTRNWFDEDQVALIGSLVSAFNRDRLPERVLNALWHHEHAHQLYYVDVRWPLMSTGLESLIHTDRHGSTRQFVNRLLAIQDYLEIDLVDREMLLTLYDRRSTVVHGKRVGDLDEETTRQYSVLEELLRAVLRKAILVDEFALTFESPDAVRSNWAGE